MMGWETETEPFHCSEHWKWGVTLRSHALIFRKIRYRNYSLKWVK